MLRSKIQIAHAINLRIYNYILIKWGTKYIYFHLDPWPIKIENQILYKILYNLLLLLLLKT